MLSKFYPSKARVAPLQFGSREARPQKIREEKKQGTFLRPLSRLASFHPEKKQTEMFPNKKHSNSKGRPRAAAQSPPSARRAAPIAAAALPSSQRRFTPSTSLIDQELETLQDTSSFLLQSLQISLDEAATAPPSPNPNPRSFPYVVKQQCWDKAEKVKGRDPDRWRRDAVGNIVFRKLVGCPGCLCHDYDHIVPYSKVRGFDQSSRLFSCLGPCLEILGCGLRIAMV